MDDRTLEKLEFPRIRQMLADCCACSLGRRWAEKLRPAHDAEVIRSRLAEATEARGLMDHRAVPFGGITDIEEEVERARPGGTLNAHELLRVADTLRGASRLRQALSADMEDYPRIAALAGRIGEFSHLVARIEATIDGEARVVDGASDELRRLRLRARRLRDSIDATVSAMLGSAAVQRALQDRLVTIRRDRPCIPVRADAKRAVPGVVHDISASGQTLFIEPAAAVEKGDELHRVRIEEEQEMARILRDLSLLVGERYADLAETLRVLSILDFIFARARLSARMGGTEPEIVDTWYVVLNKARHPLIPADQVVPINLWLGEEFDQLLITGPNTGGKTVALKTLGLLALMAMSGLHIPADENSRLPVFRGVFADIGDEQSIEQSLSTFSSHITHIARITRLARQGCLVLLDEIGAGTDPDEGSALAVAILRHLRAKGALVVATTHYNTLKTYALNEPRAENASVDFDPDTLRPTYRLLIGLPGSSNALSIAERIGLPRSIVEEARRVVPAERLRVEDAILEMERSRRSFEAQRGDLERTQREMAHEAERHSRVAEDLEQRRKLAVKEGFDEARLIVAQARQEARRILAELREQRREGRATQRAQEALGALEALVNEQAEAAQHTESSAPPPDVQEGDVVRIRSLGQRAVVLGLGGDGQRIDVSVGAARVEVGAEDIELLERAEDRQIRSSAGALQVEKALTAPREIQIRGLTVDEALPLLEKFLDDAVLAEHERVTIVHGKGTGVLRDVVREYLRSYPRALSYEYASPSEGGVGVTVVYM